MVGILEGLASVAGDELAELAGRRSTRLTAEWLPEQVMQTGVNSADGTAGIAPAATAVDCAWNGSTTVLCTNTTGLVIGRYIRLDSDGQPFEITGITPNVDITITNPGGLTIPTGTGATSQLVPTIVTLTSGAFDVAIASGQRFRILSGALTNEDEVVNYRISGAQVELRAPMVVPPVAFTGVSWQIVVDPETDVDVESVLDWPAEGVFVLDGVLHTWTSRTNFVLSGVQHYDGQNYVDGPKRTHGPTEEIVDYTRDWSVLDQYRRSFFVEYAEGDDLTVLGRNISVDRPPAMTDDDMFREVIKAIAYAPRGTMYVLEQALDATLGNGNWEIFEDLTLGSINHPGKVFFRRADNTEEDPAGKTFVEGVELAPTTALNAVTIQAEPIEVAGVRLAREGAERLVAQGSGATGCWSSDNGVTINLTTGTWPVAIQKGDFLILTDSQYRGLMGTVLTNGGATLTMGLAAGAANVSPTATGALGTSFKSTSWKVIRDKTNAKFYRPSAEVFIEYPGDPGTTIWAWNSTGLESTSAVLGIDPVYGESLIITSNGSTRRYCNYVHRLRIEPESIGEFEIYMDPVGLHGISSKTMGLQSCMIIQDGERVLAVGVIEDATGLFARFGFIDVTTGAFLGTPVNLSGSNTYWVPQLHSFVIKKNGRENVELWAKGWQGAFQLGLEGLVDTLPYLSFPTVASWTPPHGQTFSGYDFIVGIVDDTGTVGGSRIILKHIDWAVRTPDRDYWNTDVYGGGGVAAPNQYVSGLAGPFSSGDVGKRIVVKDFTVNHPGGGSPIGPWDVATYVNPTTVTLVGPRKRRASFTFQDRSRIVIRGDSKPLLWPHHRGHSIEILTGSNQGVYPIVSLLDPLYPYAPIDDRFPNFPDPADLDGTTVEEATNIVLVDTAGGSPALPNGFVVSDEEVEWRLVPDFANDGDNPAELVATGSFASNVLTMAQNFGHPIGTVMEVQRSMVRSAVLVDEKDRNDLSGGTPPYDLYPFYLHDGWGFVRDILEGLVAAGVLPEFDLLVRDDAGLHIQE